MIVGFDAGSIHYSRWRDYAVRFLFGGMVTALTGLIARRYGPAVAGLFLAFPAIFPAGATLIEKHEKEKKQSAGFDGTTRGRAATSIDAAGRRWERWVSSGSRYWSGASCHITRA